MEKRRQWQIYLVRNYNNGQPVPDNVTDGLLQMLLSRFHGVTSLPEGDGIWLPDGESISMHDNLRMVQVITPASVEAEHFMEAYAWHIKGVLGQKAVLVVSFPIDMLEAGDDEGQCDDGFVTDRSEKL